ICRRQPDPRRGPRSARLEDEGGVSPASCGVGGELRWWQAAATKASAVAAAPWQGSQDPCCLGDPGLTARDHSGSAPGERGLKKAEGSRPRPLAPIRSVPAAVPGGLGEGPVQQRSCIASSGCCPSSSSPSPSTPPCGSATPCSWASTCSASSWNGSLAQFVPWFSWQPCSSSAIAAGETVSCTTAPIPRFRNRHTTLALWAPNSQPS
ncbi:hypothetical protein DBR06_SOUSAS5010020, partial [Sousa chinensis]